MADAEGEEGDGDGDAQLLPREVVERETAHHKLRGHVEPDAEAKCSGQLATDLRRRRRAAQRGTDQRAGPCPEAAANGTGHRADGHRRGQSAQRNGVVVQEVGGHVQQARGDSADDRAGQDWPQAGHQRTQWCQRGAARGHYHRDHDDHDDDDQHPGDPLLPGRRLVRRRLVGLAGHVAFQALALGLQVALQLGAGLGQAACGTGQRVGATLLHAAHHLRENAGGGSAALGDLLGEGCALSGEVVAPGQLPHAAAEAAHQRLNLLGAALSHTVQRGQALVSRIAQAALGSQRAALHAAVEPVQRACQPLLDLRQGAVQQHRVGGLAAVAGLLHAGQRAARLLDRAGHHGLDRGGREVRHLLLQQLLQVGGVVGPLALCGFLRVELRQRERQSTADRAQQLATRGSSLGQRRVAALLHRRHHAVKRAVERFAAMTGTVDHQASVGLAAVAADLACPRMGTADHTFMVAGGHLLGGLGLRLRPPLRQVAVPKAVFGASLEVAVLDGEIGPFGRALLADRCAHAFEHGAAFGIRGVDLIERGDFELVDLRARRRVGRAQAGDSDARLRLHCRAVGAGLRAHRAGCPRRMATGLTAATRDAAGDRTLLAQQGRGDLGLAGFGRHAQLVRHCPRGAGNRGVQPVGSPGEEAFGPRTGTAPAGGRSGLFARLGGETDVAAQCRSAAAGDGQRAARAGIAGHRRVTFGLRRLDRDLQRRCGGAAGAVRGGRAVTGGRSRPALTGGHAGRAGAGCSWCGSRSAGRHSSAGAGAARTCGLATGVRFGQLLVLAFVGFVLHRARGRVGWRGVGWIGGLLARRRVALWRGTGSSRPAAGSGGRGALGAHRARDASRCRARAASGADGGGYRNSACAATRRGRRRGGSG